MARTGGANKQTTMSIMGHIQEMQRRLVLSALVLIIGASLAYIFRDPLIALLLSPLKGQSLIYLNPAGGFSFILLISIYTGLALAAPVIIHQIYCFVRPILSPKVQRYSIIVFVCSLLLLIAGVTFGYLFAIPGALNFLYEFAGEYVNASLTADSYLNFIIAYTLGLGLVFQLPLILLMTHWIKPLTPSGLIKSERWVIILAFLAAAIITPTPDPLNQTIIALPVIVVYQLGVIAVLINIYHARRLNKKTPVSSPQTQTHNPIPSHPEPIAKPQQTMPNTSQTTQSSHPSTVIERQRSVDGFFIRTHQRPAGTISPPDRRTKVSRPTRPTQTYRRGLYLDGVSRIN